MKKNSGCCLSKISKVAFYFFAFLIVIGLFAGDDKNDTTEQTSTQTKAVVASVVPTKAATQTPNITPATSQTPVATKAPIKKSDIDSIAETFKGYFVKTFDICKVEGDEEGFIIQIGMTGFAKTLKPLKATGVGSDYAEWAEMRDSLTAVVEQMVKIAESNGMDDPMVMLSLVNDEDTNMTLLTIVNGYVVYDSMAEK